MFGQLKNISNTGHHAEKLESCVQRVHRDTVDAHEEEKQDRQNGHHFTGIHIRTAPVRAENNRQECVKSEVAKYREAKTAVKVDAPNKF